MEDVMEGGFGGVAVRLVTGRDRWSEDAVGQLRDALAMAEAEPFLSVVVFGITRDGRKVLFRSAENSTVLAGALLAAAVDVARFEG